MPLISFGCCFCFQVWTLLTGKARHLRYISQVSETQKWSKIPGGFSLGGPSQWFLVKSPDNFTPNREGAQAQYLRSQRLSCRTRELQARWAQFIWARDHNTGLQRSEKLNGLRFYDCQGWPGSVCTGRRFNIQPALRQECSRPYLCDGVQHDKSRKLAWTCYSPGHHGVHRSLDRCIQHCVSQREHRTRMVGQSAVPITERSSPNHWYAHISCSRSRWVEFGSHSSNAWKACHVPRQWVCCAATIVRCKTLPIALTVTTRTSSSTAKKLATDNKRRDRAKKGKAKGKQQGAPKQNRFFYLHVNQILG